MEGNKGSLLSALRRMTVPRKNPGDSVTVVKEVFSVFSALFFLFGKEATQREESYRENTHN
jgi:hypothetical protein